MFDFLFDWFPWIAGGSTLTLIVVALLAPSVLTVASSWLSAASPLIRSAAEALGELGKALWAGFLDMTDNGKSLLFVGTVAFGAYLWGFSHGYSPSKPPPRVECPEARPGVPLPTKRPSDRSWLDGVFGNP
jgi:hypothetical protein